jgi:hypothetical protein
LTSFPRLFLYPRHHSFTGFFGYGGMKMSQEYEVEYGDDGTAQINRVPQQQPNCGMPRDQYGGQHYAPPYGYPPYKQPFRVPAIVITGLTIIVAAAIFFGIERYAPHDLKPSTNVGAFEAEVGAQMKAAELNEQARFAAYEGEMKLAVETQAKQNEMMLQALLQHYVATYDRAKLMTEAANNYQGKLLDATITQTAGVQSSDVAVVSIATLVGRGLNLLEPGSGEAAIEYAENINEGLQAGLTEAATKAVRVDLTGWNYGIAAPTEIQAMMASVRPTQLPKPPNLARHYQSAPPPSESKAR